MKTNKFEMLKRFAAYFIAVPLIFVSSCKEEEPLPDPIASFQYEISDADYLEVAFTNYSQHADSYSWDFGDGETSTEESPTHAFTSKGSYTVVLTATNADNVSATFQEIIEITDPREALKKLTGDVSKTWKLYREGNSMGIGPSLDDPYQWWSLQNDGKRPCVYMHEFTFTLDGQYIFEDNGGFWGEGLESGEMCLDAVAANMINEAGDDVSAWLGGTHAFEYTPSTGKVTLTGDGAWIGLPKLGTNDYVTVPQNSVTFDVSIEENDGYDLMKVNFIYEGGVWEFNYASYSTATEPEVVSFMVDFSFDVDDYTVTFTNESVDATSYSWDFGDGNTSTEENPTHTYAAEGAYDVVLTGTGATGSKEVTKTVNISLNPTDAAPVPTEPEADVISIYSDAYTDITGVDLDPNWGQETVTTEIEIATDENAIKMSGLNYQGIDWTGNPQDVSGKTTLHVDVYCSVVTDVNIFVIGDGENAVKLTTEAGVWKSFDIALTDYTAPDLTKVAQLKFDDAGTEASPTIFVDNIYFY